ncbi:MAG TPA: hypothetical protein PLW44_11405 [Chitinophagales bacterium]|nr:hypothetical protein [Chitinophagales bacterium]
MKYTYIIIILFYFYSGYGQSDNFIYNDTLVIERGWKETNVCKTFKLTVYHPLKYKRLLPGYYSAIVARIEQKRSDNVTHEVVFQDSCDWQMAQMLYLETSLMVKDINDDNKKDISFLYKNVGMNYEDDTVSYVLFICDTVLVVPLAIKYIFNQDTTLVALSSSLKDFEKCLPFLIQSTILGEYKRIKKIICGYKGYPL